MYSTNNVEILMRSKSFVTVVKMNSQILIASLQFSIASSNLFNAVNKLVRVNNEGRIPS
jgi:hypothetical protein